MPSNLTINIGDISIDIGWKSRRRELKIPPTYQPFAVNEKAELRLELNLGSPDYRIGEKVFDSSPVWSLHRNGGCAAIKISHNHPKLKRILILPKNFTQAALYFTEPDGIFLDPFFGPVMELLIINYLAQGHGVIFHGCGIEYRGQGMLFAGESGAGKSTLAGLWNQKNGAAVLSDDRTIVREIDGALWMFGTPWHGEAKFGSPRGVKLESIFFLRHSETNSVQPLSTANSVMQMLQCSFPTYWDAAGMRFTVEFFEKLATRVPCRELMFALDENVVDFIQGYTNQPIKMNS